MMKFLTVSASFIAAALAYTQPGAQTYGALLTPNSGSPVTTGQDYTITWSPNQPATGVTVSLVLCNGPGSNCVLQGSAIASGVSAASGSYTWSVPCSLPEGVQSTATGYGMLIIVDGTGEFQYSTQFSVEKGASCSSSSSSSTTTTTTSSSSISSSSVSTTSASTTQASSGIPSGKPSGRPTGFTDTTGGWYGWTSTLNTTTTYPTATSSLFTSASAVVTSQASYSPITKSSSTGVAASTTASAVPSTFAGAAGKQLVSFGLIGAGLLLAL